MVRFGDGFSMLLAVLMHIGQTAICAFIIKHRFKKMIKENDIVKEYKIVKNVLKVLVDEYKER